MLQCLVGTGEAAGLSEVCPDPSSGRHCLWEGGEPRAPRLGQGLHLLRLSFLVSKMETFMVPASMAVKISESTHYFSYGHV